ncbi:MAG: carboxylating nicotinate-nucleotide diphosphorylase [Methanomicrobiales archaeon]|nr:carboxylating nicotinate-nucleotide diphosphorylase [Methanomicrobiales archaeon]
MRFLEEDLPAGDITSEMLVRGIECRAVIIARNEGVVAGLEESKTILSLSGLHARLMVTDGTRVPEGARLIEIEGMAEGVLSVERTVLNLIGRMSGIATATRSMVEKIASIDSRCQIASTRKTCPGLRYLDKKAVMLGGGLPHRFSLSDMFLIKDNHLALVPLEEAIRRARRFGHFHIVEVEVSSAEEALRAAEAGADIVMLDNMNPIEVKRTLEQLEASELRKKVLIEVSGGVTEENLLDYASLDIDMISIGALTHSVKNFDVNLEVTGRI